jgi:hypothetical protein
MRRLCLFILTILFFASCAAADSVTYPATSQHPGRIVIGATVDLNDMTITTNSVVGILSRLVIDATEYNDSKPETDFTVTLKDDTGAVLFTKADCNSAVMPYSLALITLATDSDYYPGAMVSGQLTLEVQDVNYTPEVQTISTITNPFSPDAGYYTITYTGETTAHIAYNATTTAIDANLEALLAIPAGRVAAVAGTAFSYGNNIVITATGDWVQRDLSAFTIDANNLLDTGRGETQTLAITTNPFVADAGYYTITYNGQTTGHIAYGATASAIDTALELLSQIGTGGMAVTAASPLGYGNNVVLAFTPHADANAVTVTASALVDTGNAEVQTLSIAAAGVIPDAGHYHIIYSGQTSGAIAWDASAATIQTAVQALSNIGAGNMTVTAANPLAYGQNVVLTFAGTLNRGDKAAVTFDASAFVDTGNNETQTITQAVDANNGHWHITYSGTTTGAIAWDATKAGIDAALDAAFGAGIIVSTATGSIAANPVILTFSGAGVTKTDVAIVTLDYSALLDDATPVPITASETVKGKADVNPTVAIGETVKGVADVTPTVTVTETLKGVEDVYCTPTVTETQKGRNDLSQVTADIYYIPNQ